MKGDCETINMLMQEKAVLEDRNIALGSLAASLTSQIERQQVRNSELQAKCDELLGAAKELADLVDDILSGGYKPDGFTTQPIRIAIAKARGQQ